MVAAAPTTAMRIFGSLAAIQAPAAAGRAACALRGADRGLRGIRSYDLPAYVDHLADRIGKPSLVVCLDSGCGNYEQLWCTTSLRGLAGGNFTVKVLEEGVHSGDASGVVPSSFRSLRQLLSRLEDEQTGRILPEGPQVEIPADRLAQAQEAARVLDTAVFDQVLLPARHDPDGRRPGRAGAQPHVAPRAVGHRCGRHAAAVFKVGNVLRPYTSVKLSLRLPPTLDGKLAGQLLKDLLENDAPNGAQVSFRNWRRRAPAGTRRRCRLGWNR